MFSFLCSIGNIVRCETVEELIIILKNRSSIFHLVHDVMTGTIFFQLIMGVIFMSLNNFNVEMVRFQLKKIFEFGIEFR